MLTKRHLVRSVALLAASLLLGACTPEQAVWFWFHDTPAQHAEAQSVVGCESRWDPTAVSPTNDHGLFQIHGGSSTWQGWPATFERVTGQPWSAVYEPFWNARFARFLYDDAGGTWRHWTCQP